MTPVPVAEKEPWLRDLAEVAEVSDISKWQFYRDAYAAGATALLNEVGHYEVRKPFKTSRLDGMFGHVRTVTDHFQSLPITISSKSGDSERESAYVVGVVVDSHIRRFPDLTYRGNPVYWDREEYYIRPLKDGRPDYGPRIERTKFRDRHAGEIGRRNVWQIEDECHLPYSPGKMQFWHERDTDDWKTGPIGNFGNLLAVLGREISLEMPVTRGEFEKVTPNLGSLRGRVR